MPSFMFIVFSVLIWWAIVTTHRLTTFKARSHLAENWSWARDVNGRDRDVCLPRPRRDWDVDIFLETRPRRDVGTFRDRLETETSRPRPQPWSTVWGLEGGDKTLNTRRIQLWHCCYCDMWQIQMHIQWCRHQMFISHWQSVTQTVQSIFFAVRWFSQIPWPPLLPTPRLFQGSHGSLKVLEGTWIFSPKFKALKVLKNRTGARKCLNFIPQVLESPWIHQVKLCDISNFVKQHL